MLCFIFELYFYLYYSALSHNKWFCCFRSVHGSSAAEFQANLKKIYTVRSAQGFWAVYNNIPGADEIQVNDTPHLMGSSKSKVANNHHY